MKQQLLELPFIDREKDTDLLKQKYSDTLANRGGCVLLVGEPGIGKSRLVDEFLTREVKNAMTLRISTSREALTARQFFADIIRSYILKKSHVSRIITR